MDSTKISHYRILEKLGAGGMGEVYLAEDMKLGRKVALKILSAEYTTNRDRLQRFEQEASAASALNHPNILTIHEVGVDEGHHFIATEYIDGITLRRKVAVTTLETREVLDIAVQVASALEEAHAAGIVHRDIKPDNIMVRRNGYVKVLDFGLAKLTELSTDRSPSDGEASTRVLVQTDAGVVMGTSHYMSPEQARGKPVDLRSDIWSLGVVIYEMVAGRTPFQGETSTDVIVAITQKEPPPIARFAPNVPAELDWIVTKALRKDREERYQTIKELLTDLRRLKQRLEFEQEMERSIAPGTLTGSSVSNLGASFTVPERPLPTVEKSVSHVSSAEYIVNGIKRHKLMALIALFVVVVVVGAAIYVGYHRGEPLTDKDTILVTDFVNTTGEAVFDGTLKQALVVQLGQTPFLNLFPDDRVRETLGFMGKAADERITRDIGREICQRQGIKALLIGSIAKLGGNYVITLEALNGQSGDSIAREQVEAESKEKVLSSLGTASSNLRKKLGESLSSIQKYDVGIEQATTSSLDALKAYAMGNEERAKGRTRESLTFYQRAVDLDPNFAMAYARIGVFYANQDQFELARESVQKAYDLRDRVSERERLYILEKYNNYVTGDSEEATKVLQTWARLYPNDFIPHNNLSIVYQMSGRYDEALKESLEAVRLSPDNSSARQNVVGNFIALGRIDEAEQAAREIAKINPDQGFVHSTNFFFAFLRRDQAGMDRETNWARGRPEEADFESRLALMAVFFGKLKEAESHQKRAFELYKAQNRKENAAQITTSFASRIAPLGKKQESVQLVKSALEVSRDRLTIISGSLALAFCGDYRAAQSLLDETLAKYPRDTPIVNGLAPLARAGIERGRGNNKQALELLDSIRGYDFALTGVGAVYARAIIYLEEQMGGEAATEFKKVIAHPYADPMSPLHTLAHLGLARALVLMGDTSGARKSYQDFLAQWKDADADLPVIVEAKKEYEQLK
jgi:serine/threonine protein kinase/tetratricopeptide (TPR) repeat protein